MKEFFDSIISNPAIGRISIVVVGFVLILVIIQIAKKSLSKRIKADNWYKTKKTINVVGYILFILLVLVVYNDSLGGITVALGVAGAGIAFALQEVITSVAGWIAILVGGFYKTGDRVLVGGIKGDVIDQSILRTTLMELGDWVDGDLYNGRIVRIANSFVFKEPVFNYSADFPFLWDEIKIPIKFGSDYERARTLIKKAADKTTGDYLRQSQTHWDAVVRKYKIENASLENTVTIRVNDNWVEYVLRYVVDYKTRRSTQNTLYTEILTELSKTGGAVELASATINITEVPTIKFYGKNT